MSAKKSWDLERKPARVSAPEPVAAARGVSTRNVTIARGAKVKKEAGPPLKARRRKQQVLFRILLGVLLLAVIAGTFYVLWLPVFRVNAVSVEGPDSAQVQELAQAKLQGAYFWILPRNSLFFIPQKAIRKSILENYADIEAVSMSAHGLHTLVIQNIRRVTAFWWCGTSLEAAPGTCYETDAEGLLFAQTDLSMMEASTTPLLKMYMMLDAPDAAAPLRSHIANATVIPNILRMVKALRSLGANIDSVILRDDEVDLKTAGGTRITYVLGHEAQAAALAATALPTLDVNDGSIEYVELRFEGKVYVKKRGE